jgi:site-specific recombinase XerD
MSLQSRQELLLAIRPQYLNASKPEKKKLLDGLVTATGYDRKYAVTLLSKGLSKKRGRRARQRKYDQAVLDALLIVWNASNRICSKRMIPFMPSLVESLEKFGHLSISDTVKAQLLTVSPATADRLLLPERRKYGRSKGTTKPGYLIKKHIPIRTFADWNDVVPGFLEADLVAHCGENVRGQFLHTLTVTDIATGWTELGALMGKGESDVLREIAEIKGSLPFPLKGLDTDNGGEFINYGLVDWCVNNSITFTRSREYKKNDQAHVEEKNGSIVRRLIGYDRYEGIESWQLLSQLYRIARLYINYFQPCLKLISKERDGARVHKRYDKAQTPCERTLSSLSVAEEMKARLRERLPTLDPVLLLREMERLQNELWKTAIGQQQVQETAVQEKKPRSAETVERGDGTSSESATVATVVREVAPTPTRKARANAKNRTASKEKRPRTKTLNQDLCLEAPAAQDDNGTAIIPTKRPESDAFCLELIAERFLGIQLVKQGVTPNTIASYRDSLRLFLQFNQRRLNKDASALSLIDVNAKLVCAFLDDMENRGTSAGTCNLRLAAIRSFCRYAIVEVPAQSLALQPIMAIATKQYDRPAFDFLSPKEVEAVLAAPDRTTWCGRRDHALLTVAVQTGLLVGELMKLSPQDVDLGPGAHVRIIGTGRKQRRIPLTKDAAAVLEAWMREPIRPKTSTLFPNARGGRLTTCGVGYILNNHIGSASEVCPSLQEKRVTPFILRHTAAMQLLQAGTDRDRLAAWLGLESVSSTQAYITANLAMKKQLIKDQRR